MAFEELAPSIRIEVEGHELSADVTKLVHKCVVEQSQDLAWKIDLTVLNVANDTIGSGWDGKYLFTDSKVFQPGNRINVRMGYAGQERLVGSGVIQRYLPRFPRSGAPVLQIVAYDGRSAMIDGEGAQDAMAWEDVPHSDIIHDIAAKYGYNSEVEVTNAEKRTIKKQGMSDWELVQGLARLHGFYSVVEWDEDAGNWAVKWGPDPFKQDAKYTFQYSAAGQDNTLLDFSPELAIKGLPTTVKLYYWDKDSRTWEEVLFEEADEGEGLKYTGNTSGAPEDEILSSTSFRIATGGVAVEVVPRTQFTSAEDALKFGERWFRARKDQFITGRGSVIGTETLRPGHTHALLGLGKQLSGDYQFTTVRHIFTPMDGYRCEFFAHKVVE